MRAKMRVSNVVEAKDSEGKVIEERYVFDAVYSPDPETENYTWSKYTPFAHLEMTVTNSNLFGHFKNGQEIYLDFIPVAQPVA